MTEEISTLIDNFNRQVTYLRISVTDRCDLRCVYCMSEDMTFVPRAELLTLEEIEFISRAFVELGVTKLRITGGEPLTRNNILSLFQQIGQLKNEGGLQDFTMTTNGTQLAKYAKDLKSAGLTRINVSLDTLREDRFKTITRVGKLNKTLDGLATAKQHGFNKIKLNSVILKNRNDDEILDLVDYAVENEFDISFIEEMPLGMIGDHDREETFFSSDEVMAVIAQKYSLYSSTETTGGPSRYFRLSESKSRVGFISPHSHNFCDQCNRVRLTATGRLLLCLGQEHSVDLRQVARTWPFDMQRMKSAIIDSMNIKPKGHDFNLSEQPVILRHMNTTGG